MKIAVVGNCQARPLASYMSGMNPSVEIGTTTIVHLLGNADEERVLQELSSADLVISQMVADDYLVGFVSTSMLRELLGERLVTIVNLFLTGYTPSWFSFRDSSGKLVPGPMDTYHSKIVLKAFLDGRSVEESAALLDEAAFDMDAARESLASLRSREARGAVGVTDFIEQNFFATRLFHTHNHPSNVLLAEYAQRILRQIGMWAEGNFLLPREEALGAIAPALPRGFEKQELFHKGVGGFLDREGNFRVTSTKDYNSQDLVVAFYDLYNAKSADPWFTQVLKDKIGWGE